jgi:hypothetical protein
MEEGHQKSKILLYMVKFKHEIVQCSEEMGNCIATIFGDGERSV